MKYRRRWAAIVLAALAAACDPDPADRGPGAGMSVVHDSSGIRIVENGALPAANWRVDTTPRFTVGWDADDPTFTWIQAGRILPDGGALVSDFAAGSLYRIRADGSVAATWGRKGEGPGEYEALDAILLPGDSILVSDSRLRRVTLLSFDGDVLATHTLPGGFLHEASSVLTDGRLLLVPGDGYGGPSGMRPEWVFERQPIIAAGLDGSTVDTLAELPHLRRWYGTRGAGPGPVVVKGRAGGFSDGFAWSRADVRAVRWYDGSGRLIQIARWDEEPVPLTPTLRRETVERIDESWRSAGADEAFIVSQLREVEEGLERHDGPLPFWDAFHVDRQGNAWLRRYSMLGERSDAWRVITRDGVFVGWIELPGVVSILDITDARILAVRQDSLDVAAVVMLPLLKQ